MELKPVIVVLFCVGCATAQPMQQPLVEVDRSVPDIDPSGTYTGTYTCPQGETGLNLLLMVSEDGRAIARFDFYSVDATAYDVEGSFKMKGLVTNDGAVSLQASEEDWLKQPTGFVTVDLEGTLDRDTQTINGVIVQPECSTFTVRRAEK